MNIKILKAVPLMGALFLTACGYDTKSDWLENVDGNEFRIVTKSSESDNIVSVENKMRTWNGHYQGGGDKIEMRKNLMMKLADKDADRLCKQEPVTKVSQPYIVMTDRENPVTNQGIIPALIGQLVIQATTKDENVPRSLSYHFKCGTVAPEPKHSEYTGK
ncbi:MAG: hypothetical protein KBF71_07240 [Alphaproteobacteria bacterium]|jgi:hypothetical protein|nr:hypothetical protein [Alphaproteobacteria bacterium]